MKTPVGLTAEQLVEWKAKQSASNRAYYMRHKAERKAYRQARAQEQQAYYATWYATHRAQAIADVLAWIETHREVARRYQRQRYAQMKATSVGPIDYEAIKLRDGMICSICGNGVEECELSFDHTIPVALGGPHIEENIRVAHRKCNERKGARIQKGGIRPRD